MTELQLVSQGSRCGKRRSNTIAYLRSWEAKEAKKLEHVPKATQRSKTTVFEWQYLPTVRRLIV